MEEATNPEVRHEVRNTFMSEEINEITAALSQLQGSIEQPKLEKEVKVKTKTGSSYSFKYADLSACCKAAAPHLMANGLAVAQVISGGKLVTLLSHKSGQWMKSELFLPQQTSDYQSYGSAITYLKRYSYCALLGIVADTDDDGNFACGNQMEYKQTKPTADITADTKKAIQSAADAISAATTENELHEIYGKFKNSPIQTDVYAMVMDRFKWIRENATKA